MGSPAHPAVSARVTSARRAAAEVSTGSAKSSRAVAPPRSPRPAGADRALPGRCRSSASLRGHPAPTGVRRREATASAWSSFICATISASAAASSSGIAGEAQLFGHDPGDAPEPGDEVPALNDNSVQVEIAEPGIGRARRVARREASGCGGLRGERSARPSRLSRGPASGSENPAVSSKSSDTRGSASRLRLCWARSDNSSNGLASNAQAVATSDA